MPQTTHFTMVNTGIHELLQKSINDLIDIGGSMAQSARRSKASKYQAARWWAAVGELIRVSDQLSNMRGDE